MLAVFLQAKLTCLILFFYCSHNFPFPPSGGEKNSHGAGQGVQGIGQDSGSSAHSKRSCSQSHDQSHLIAYMKNIHHQSSHTQMESYWSKIIHWQEGGGQTTEILPSFDPQLCLPGILPYLLTAGWTVHIHGGMETNVPKIQQKPMQRMSKSHDHHSYCTHYIHNFSPETTFSTEFSSHLMYNLSIKKHNLSTKMYTFCLQFEISPHQWNVSPRCGVHIHKHHWWQIWYVSSWNKPCQMREVISPMPDPWPPHLCWSQSHGLYSGQCLPVITITITITQAGKSCNQE